MYEHAASHLVKQIFEGFNATIFAYGQTGAGKTYSMEGKLGSPHRGIVPRVVENIFEAITDADEQFEFMVSDVIMTKQTFFCLMRKCEFKFSTFLYLFCLCVILFTSYKYHTLKFIWKCCEIY